jgi:hypothetical protein
MNLNLFMRSVRIRALLLQMPLFSMVLHCLESDNFYFRLGMRPWIAVAYSAPVAAATAVFLIYPIGQGSFSWYASRNLWYFQLYDCIPG